MNVFVTGGAGYIGSVCVEELLNAGHTVTVFDNLTEGHRSAVDTRAAFIQGDFNDRDLIHLPVRQTKDRDDPRVVLTIRRRTDARS